MPDLILVDYFKSYKEAIKSKPCAECLIILLGHFTILKALVHFSLGFWMSISNEKLSTSALREHSYLDLFSKQYIYNSDEHRLHL